MALKDDYVCEGQVNITDLLEQIEAEPVDYSKYLVKHLVEHCEYWGYDWIEKLQENKTVDNFFKLFCKVTKTFYFYVDSRTYYSAVFDKKEEKVTIKKCGPDYDKQKETHISIQEVLDKLPGR